MWDGVLTELDDNQSSFTYRGTLIIYTIVNKKLYIVGSSEKYLENVKFTDALDQLYHSFVWVGWITPKQIQIETRNYIKLYIAQILNESGDQTPKRKFSFK